MENRIVKTLQNRLATRSISREALKADQIKVLMESVRLTPSCFNNQPWRYLFLESETSRIKGAETLAGGNKSWASRAPLLIVGYSQKGSDCLLPGREYHQFDLGMSAMNLMLAATEMGLVARPMAGFDPTQVRRQFNLSESDQPLVIIGVGYPSTEEDHLPDHYRGISTKTRERKSLDEIIQRV